MFKKALFLSMIIGVTLSTSGCAGCARFKKTISSDIDGGLNRTVTVYDYNGEEIKSWTGKFDVSASEHEVFFDNSDGKRVIIHGGIIINEEN